MAFKDGTELNKSNKRREVGRKKKVKEKKKEKTRWMHISRSHGKQFDGCEVSQIISTVSLTRYWAKEMQSPTAKVK